MRFFKNFEPELMNFRDIRGAINDSYRLRRKYDRTGKVMKPKTARFKMLVEFKDGGRFVGYSFDYHPGPEGKTLHDEWLGLDALLYQLNEWNQHILSAAIFCNLVDVIPYTDQRRYNCVAFNRWINKKTGKVEIRENKDVEFNLPTHDGQRVKLKPLL